MSDVKKEDIRNIGIAAHIDAGKTTLTERILFYTGKTYRIGEVDQGSAEMDWMEQEKERGITITSAATTCFWVGKKINIIDTPGHVDFTVEVERSLRVLDGMIGLFCAVGGVEPQSETVWHQADRYKIPRIAFVNKLDRIGADYELVIKEIKERFSSIVVPINFPVGLSENFRGVIDIIRERALLYVVDPLGVHYENVEIPSFYQEKVEEYRLNLLETLAEINELAMEYFTEGTMPTAEEFDGMIRDAVVSNNIVPVMAGSAKKNIAIQPLLDAIIKYLPSPLDIPPVEGINPATKKVERRITSDEEHLSALAFKVSSDKYIDRLLYVRVYSGVIKKGKSVLNPTKDKRERVGRILEMHANDRTEIEEVTSGNIAVLVGLKETSTGDTLCSQKQPIILGSIEFPEPVISVSVEPMSQADEEKLNEILDKLAEEDPTFVVRLDENTGQTIISGMGELHLEILIDKMLRDYNLKVLVGKPQVAYKETITSRATGEGIVDKVAAGKSMFGHVKIVLEPNERGGGFEFINKSSSFDIPEEFVNDIKMGFIDATTAGVIASFPVIDVVATLTSGSYKKEESTDIAFRIASSRAFYDAMKKGKPVLLEPLMKLVVNTPVEYVGDVLADFNIRRGDVSGMDQKGEYQIITAYVPIGELFGYATELRNRTKGRANFSMEFERYDVVPVKIMEEIINRVSGGTYYAKT